MKAVRAVELGLVPPEPVKKLQSLPNDEIQDLLVQGH